MAIEGSFEGERRRAALRAELESEGQVSITGFAQQFGVHTMTVRRDLEQLEQAGLVRRVRGGAVFVGPQIFSSREGHAADAKSAIADKLLTLIPRTGSIGLDASTTVGRLARQIKGTRELVVLTYGIEAFQALQAGGARAWLTAGERDPQTGSLVGPMALESTQGFGLTRAILSATALHPQLGSSNPTPEETAMKRALAAASDHIVLALDSSKLGQVAPVRSLALDEIDLLVTELDPADPALDPYRDKVEIL